LLLGVTVEVVFRVSITVEFYQAAKPVLSVGKH